MTMKKIISNLSIFLFALAMLCASSYDYELREPDSKKRRDDDYVGVIIKTNVEGAEVYINGESFGETPVATVDLSATTYTLEIRKSGYDTIKCRIHPKRYYTYVYNFTMVKTCGYIEVRNYPSGSTVYVDGSSHNSFPIEVSPGNHTVKVRKFGYHDFSEQIYVENHSTVRVNAYMDVAPFSISNFKISKNVINPDYKSSIGKVTISFHVTNDGSAIVSVNDRYGNSVWTHKYSSFSTWEQSVSWDGNGNDGERIPDGTYTVTVYGLGYEFSETIKVDRSLSYPAVAFTTGGSGVGTLPCAFGNNVDYVKLAASFGATMNIGENSVSVTGFPITAGMLIDIGSHVELGGSFSVSPSTSSQVETPLRGGASLKVTGGVNMFPSLKLNFAGLCNYNYCKNKGTGYGSIDMRSGVTLGAATGVESDMLYAGASAEYTIGIKDRNMLKCGAVVSFMPVKVMRASVWGALYNAEVAEAGVEIISMPAASAFSIDVKAWMLKDLSTVGKNMVLNAQIGLSYLF